MSRSVTFSAIELTDGLYQIQMLPSDIPLTAMSTPSGMLWEWLVMPQGYKNTLATFKLMMFQVLRPLQDFSPNISMTSLSTVALRVISSMSKFIFGT